MLNPGRVFAAGSALASLSWLCLGASLFMPPVRPWAWSATALVAPALLGVAYAILLVRGVRERTGGNFRSIEGVRRLFTSDAALAAGWLHYLAFDLFVGSWIARAGLAAPLPPLLILPCLMLTFLAGPAGLVAFTILRFAVTGQVGTFG